MNSTTGTPRGTSLKTAAISRSGNSAGVRVVRINATTSPTTRTQASTATKSLTSSQKPRRTAGKEALKSLQLKYVALTSSQPDDVTTIATSPPMTTNVD